ncbi:MAG: DUF3866 family protein [Coriobacteriales bacterium]|jgi:hypothetical protein|nr:DUF3866 family protein [Coriobacteriales bacterium]
MPGVKKLRGTSLEREVVSVEDRQSQYHDIMGDAGSLAEAPVVCCELVSQVPFVAAAVKHARPNARVAYCMTDQGSLILEPDGLIARSKSAGLIDSIITCGQAVGGDMEAVNVYSGLLACRYVLEADVTICGIGPGSVGTATPFGTSAVAQGESLNAVCSLNGTPIMPLRVSFAEKRERHYGVSYHSITVLTDICLEDVIVAVPKTFGFVTDSGLDERRITVEHTLKSYHIHKRHDIIPVDINLAEIDMRGVNVTTLGRADGEDSAYYAAAAAAGLVAVHG